MKIFRNVRKQLASENKVMAYLRYAVGEIILVVIGILIALQVNNWNENRKNRQTEIQILTEISQGLAQDQLDMNDNISGHKTGLQACEYWTHLVFNEPVNTDSLVVYYHYLVRDFASIQNTSGYTFLKSKGLDIIKDDSIRIEITSVYEQDYYSIRKLEENYKETQFFSQYFKDINNIISPYLIFDKNGTLESIKVPLNLTNKDRNLMLSYLWKIKENRLFILNYYSNVIQKIERLQLNINNEIKSIK